MRIVAIAMLVAVIGIVGAGSSASGGTDSTSLRALAQFIALARGMTEGSFAATYTLPATKGSAAGAATLYVAQRLPASESEQQAPMIGDEGEWIYRLTTGNGAVYELLKNGSSLFDCWRSALAKAFRCTGPGSLGQFGIGLDIAAQLYVPGTAEVELRNSVIAPFDKPALTAYRTNSVFGELSCLRARESDGMTFNWCLSATGRLVTQSRPGSIGYPWTTIELEHLSDDVSTAAFELSGPPRGSFSVLPTMTLPPPAPPQ